MPAMRRPSKRSWDESQQAEKYAIHGGGVPSKSIPLVMVVPHFPRGVESLIHIIIVRVRGVEGIVAVVIVSGLKQHEDHGVIVDVINSNWQ